MSESADKEKRRLTINKLKRDYVKNASFKSVFNLGNLRLSFPVNPYSICKIRDFLI